MPNTSGKVNPVSLNWVTVASDSMKSGHVVRDLRLLLGSLESEDPYYLSASYSSIIPFLNPFNCMMLTQLFADTENSEIP